MKLFALSSVTVLSLAVTTLSAHAESKKDSIPLKDIWAYDMPRTRDVQKLNPSVQNNMVGRIQESLGQKGGDFAREGFVVQGDEKDALQKTYDVLVLGKPPEKTSHANQQTWIVFYSRSSGQYVHLDEVRREANSFTAFYRFAPHDSKEMTQHFALIPVGKLPDGNYRVSMKNLPMEKSKDNIGYQPLPESVAVKIVCKPFQFVVGEDEKH